MTYPLLVTAEVAREAQLARWLERHLSMVCPQEQVKEKEAR